MADKIRLTQHSGKGSAEHNDRENILKAKEKGKDIQDKHIDLERTRENITYVFDAENNIKARSHEGRLQKPLHEYEKEFYEQRYGESLRVTNEKYIKQRHPEKVKTIEDMLKSYSGKTFNGKDRANPTAPEEIIVQVGNMQDNVDIEIVKKCFSEYTKALMEFSQEHKENIHLLDVSMHMDEAVPHLHIRRVIDYKDEQGLIRVGQLKGLEQAGIELPDPTKNRTRYNNRKMTIDKLMRDKFIEICKSKGLDIETTPEQGKRHNRTKEEIIAERLEIQVKNQEAILDKQLETYQELESLQRDVLGAVDDLLELPQGKFLEIVENVENNRSSAWSRPMTSFKEDVIRDVQLYQDGYLTDKDLDKDRDKAQERDLEI